MSSYGQKVASPNKTTAMQPSGITIEAPTFSIEKVYPNPVKDFINIELRSEVAGAVKLSLINILGTEVKKWDEFYLHQGNQKLKIDLTSFNTGIYILKISKADQIRTQLLKKN
jgi:hypothetical protein